MKTTIPINKAYRMLGNGPVILVTCQHEGRPNIITLAWSTPISFDPPIVGISVAKTHYSHGLIKKGGEFVINIPHEGLLKSTHICGTVSGKNKDKFTLAELTATSASKVVPPLIEECIGHIECKLKESHDIGDHTLFVGDVVAASADKGLFADTWSPEAKTLHHLGGDKYMVAGRHLKA